MNIAIEILIILVLFIILMFWAIWKRITDKINKKKYVADNDKSRKGEEARRAELAKAIFGRGESGIKAAESEPASPDDEPPRPSEPSERALLPPATSDSPVEPERNTGKDDSGTGTSGKSNRGFFALFRRNK